MIKEFLKAVVRVSILPILFIVEDVLELPARTVGYITDALYEATVKCDEGCEEDCCFPGEDDG